MKKLPSWAIYLVFCVAVIAFIPIQEYLADRFSPKRNYQRGLQDGMENSEYYCYSFDPEYIGSLNYIKSHDPKLYEQIMTEQ